MSEARDCIVKLVDDHGVEHSVRVRAESVYESALKGLQKLERVGWESSGEQIGWVTVEVWEEPTQHRVHGRENARMDKIERKNAARRDAEVAVKKVVEK
jgi:hypothetical protein